MTVDVATYADAVASDYLFRSSWVVGASSAQCAELVEKSLQAAVGALPWWPAVGVIEAPTTLSPGSAMTLRVRSPYGYRLTARLRLTEFEPGRRISVRSTGDLDGEGVLEIVGGGSTTRLDWTWAVTPTRPWMRITGALLRPVFTHAHARVMADGERGLRRELARASRH